MIEKINEKILKLKFFQIPIINKIYTKIFTKEIILYLIFGVLTTIINIAAFSFFTYIIFKNLPNEELNIFISNTIAFILAIIFAFITNKKYVFESNEKNAKKSAKEFITFLIARLFTFGIDTYGVIFFVTNLHISKIISKIIFNIIVIILNYIFSKLLIFQKTKSE